MAGPVLRAYKGGSIVYFEKDKSDDIYVLQSGRVILTYSALDSKQEIKEDVRLGEFFGVKSAMGHYPREETAQVIGGANLLVFKPQEFEQFVSNKTHLILKMLKVFSSQLRQIHRQVREQLGQGDAKLPAYELMNVGEVFYKNNNLDHAIYVFNTYLTVYPQGKYVGRATELLTQARKGSPYPINMPELVYETETTSAKSSNAANLIQPATPPKPPVGNKEDTITDLYNRGNLFAKAGKVEEAMNIFRSVMERTDGNNPLEKRQVENSMFQLGKCHLKQNQNEPAFSTLSNYVRKYPRGEFVKESIYNLASIAENQGDKPKAVMLYEKVVQMSPSDEMTQNSQKKIRALK